MKNALGVFALIIAITVGSATALPALRFRDDAAAAEEAARQRAEAAAVRARELGAAREAKATQDWIDRLRRDSDARLSLAENRSAVARWNENDMKFADLQQSARELAAVSRKVSDQIDSSGAQSVSISFFSDLERIEKLVKKMRTNAK